MGKKKNKLIAAKKLCNEAKIGDEIVCPSCGTKHKKKSYQSVFCKTKRKTKCKDYFWNNVDENKRKNTTRISPASARFLASLHDENEDYNPDDNEHPHSSDALGQWDD